MTTTSTSDKRAALQELSEETDSHHDWWLFPSEDPIQGFMGTDPIFFVGDQPSMNPWPPDHPNRRAFYETLKKVGVPNAHLTDLYKKRGRCSALQTGLPADFPDHVRLFRKEIDILQPGRIVALGNLAFRLLMQHVRDYRPKLRPIWHFSYAVRSGRLSEYEASMRRAIGGA